MSWNSTVKKVSHKPYSDSGRNKRLAVKRAPVAVKISEKTMYRNSLSDVDLSSSMLTASAGKRVVLVSSIKNLQILEAVNDFCIC